MKKSRSRLFRARAVCEAYTSFPRGAHPRGAFYVIGISYHIINRLSATGFALCDEQPGCPRSRALLRSRARADALYRLLSQAARSLMAREKQMPLSASLVFLSCSRFSPSITSPRWRALPPASAGCSFSNGTRNTNAAFSVACFSFVLII